MKLHRMEDVHLALGMVQADSARELGASPLDNYAALDSLAKSASTLSEAAEALVEEVESKLADAERKADAAVPTEGL